MAVALVLAAAGCGDGDGGSGSGELTVVATTTQVADLAGQVGGERVDVEGLLRPGGDPHDYEPRPSDVAAVAKAGVIFRSGGEVDEWLGEVTGNAGGDAEAIALIDSVERAGRRPALVAGPAQRGAGDRGRSARRSRRPTRTAARRTRRTPGAPARSSGAWTARSPRASSGCRATKRKVVTTHDSLGYFASRYGIEVVGSVIPSLSTHAQASAGDVDELVRQIRDEGVEAIFPESAVSPDIERAIARESGATVGDALYADSLGPEGSAGETYAGALAADAEALVRGMSGGRVDCGL